MTNLRALGRSLAGCCVLTASACVGSFHEVRAPFDATIALGLPPSVVVSNAVGEIRLEPGDGNTVTVRATKYASDRTALNNIEIQTRRTNQGVVIQTIYHADRSGGVRYDIAVPRNASVDVVNTIGTITIGPVDGNVAARTATGGVVVKLGRVAAHRLVDLRTGTGRIDVSMAGDSSANVSATSTIGSISSAFPSVESSRSSLVGARAAGVIGNGEATVRLAVGTGSIAIDRE